MMDYEESTLGISPQETEKIYSVTQINEQLKRFIDTSFAPLWVCGEVSNLRFQASGHIYFSLKDEGGQIACSLFRQVAGRLKVQLREGMQLLVFGKLDVYGVRGTYQMIAQHVIDSGVGRLKVEYEKLKARLAAEGLFDIKRKQPIPTLVKKLAVITSLSGAALQDFKSILERNGWSGSLYVFPARVQGEGAAAQMIEQLRQVELFGGIELVVLCRGGGSMEDLWEFNKEGLVRAIDQCALPVISAVGHQTDYTLCDFVADARAETPSGAAEMISAAQAKLRSQLELLERGLRSVFSQQMQRFSESLLRAQSIVERLGVGRVMREFGAELAGLSVRFERGFGASFEAILTEVDMLTVKMKTFNPRERVYEGLRTLVQLEKRLWGASYQQSLKRGFAIVRDDEGKVVRSVKALQTGDGITVELGDGRFGAQVFESYED